MKAGYKTSEFWITLVALAIPVLVHLGIFSPAEGQQVTETAANFITELFDLIGVIVPTAYVISRSYLKANVS